MRLNVALEPTPLSGPVAFISQSGGMSVVGADSLASLGMKVPPLDEQARLKIKEILPPHAPIPTNPVDFAGGARTAVEEAKVAEILASLDYIDGIITNVPVTAFASNAIGEYVKIGIKGAEILAGIPEKYNKPVVCMRFSEISDDITSSIIKSAGIPAYSTPEDAARAMYALVKYSRISVCR